MIKPNDIPILGIPAGLVLILLILLKLATSSAEHRQNTASALAPTAAIQSTIQIESEQIEIVSSTPLAPTLTVQPINPVEIEQPAQFLTTPTPILTEIVIPDLLPQKPAISLAVELIDTLPAPTNTPIPPPTAVPPTDTPVWIPPTATFTPVPTDTPTPWPTTIFTPTPWPLKIWPTHTPTPIAISWGPTTEIIPDSELIYGRSSAYFSLQEAVPSHSYLRWYVDDVEGAYLSGIDIIELVAERNRIHPRFLLAALEYRSGWVTQALPDSTTRPMQYGIFGASGLYQQLKWTANQLNAAYYGRVEINQSGFYLADGTWIHYEPDISNGTAAVQRWLGAHSTATYESWYADISSTGFLKTYQSLFGDPEQYELPVIDPIYLTQPYLALPWAKEDSWYFTGGPHGGWGVGSAWAALDFVSPRSMGGCLASSDWVLAVADGVIAYSRMGQVILDLDMDGQSGTGWGIVYQHIATNDRITRGTVVKAGDRIGHPSCEGGYSTGTHLHIARIHDGRWLSADSYPAFNLDGWVALGSGNEYNGTLSKHGYIKIASVGRSEGNRISAEP